MSVYDQPQNIFNFPNRDEYEEIVLTDYYEYGFTADGEPNPGPCPICGWPLYSCPGENPIDLIN